jgi:hypothetical protein
MTQNKTYAAAAQLSAEFIFAQLYDNTNGIVLQRMDLGTCIATSADNVLSSDSGKVIEGLADMALWNASWASR